MKKVFEDDFRKSNPGLHLLYVKHAIKHLRYINKCIKKFNGFSNTNMLPILEALTAEKDKLIANNAAYADANEIILIYRGKKPTEAEPVATATIVD